MNPHQDHWVSVVLILRAIGAQVPEPWVSCVDGTWAAPSHVQGERGAPCMGQQNPLSRPTSRWDAGLLLETCFHACLLLLDFSFARPGLGLFPPCMPRTQPDARPVAGYIKAEGTRAGWLESRKEIRKKCRKRRGLQKLVILKMDHHLQDFLLGIDSV